MISYFIDFLFLLLHFFLASTILHTFLVITVLCKHFYGNKFIWTLLVCSGFYVTTVQYPIISLPISALYLLLSVISRWYEWKIF